MKKPNKIICSECLQLFNGSLYSNSAIKSGRKFKCAKHLSPKSRARKGGVHHPSQRQLDKRKYGRK